MDYFDSEIIGARHIKRRDEYGSIEEGLYINNMLTTFRQILLFEEKVSVMLPEDFVPMLPEIVNVKYALGNVPDIIYTSLDTSVNISFNLYTDALPDGDIQLSMGVLKRMMKNMNPSYVFYDDRELENIDGCKIGVFDFKSYALDDAIYNIVYMIQMNHYIVQGAFNCMYYDIEEWKRAANEIIKTVRIMEL